MRIAKSCAVIAVAIFLSAGTVRPFPVAEAATATPNVTVEPQYDTAHVYVAPEDFDRFVASLVATFGEIGRAHV